MAAPTLVGLAAQVTTLMAQVTTLQAQIAALQASKADVDKAVTDHWALRAEITARNTAGRLGELEAYVQENRALIEGLNESDEASGWKKWREAREAKEQTT